MKKEYKKRYRNPFFLALIWIFVIVILIMFGSYLLVDKTTHQVEKEYLDTANHDVLSFIDTVQDEKTGFYYQLSWKTEQNDLIAFQMTEEKLDTVEYCAGSYYPESYWQGDCETKDLSAIFGKKAEMNSRIPSVSLLKNVEVYDIAAYKGYESRFGSGQGIAMFFLWVVEVGVGGIIFIIVLILGVITQVHHRQQEKNQAQ